MYITHLKIKTILGHECKSHQHSGKVSDLAIPALLTQPSRYMFRPNMHLFISGRIDSSGMRIYMTETLREYHTKTSYVGVTVVPYQLIPPRMERFQSDGYCFGECLLDVGQPTVVCQMLLCSTRI